MIDQNKKQIGHLYFCLDQPTELTFIELRTWVMWQFPYKEGQVLAGAVHPPIQKHGWLPAHIWPQQERVMVYAHLNSTYTSPEAAAAAI